MSKHPPHRPGKLTVASPVAAAAALLALGAQAERAKKAA